VENSCECGNNFQVPLMLGSLLSGGLSISAQPHIVAAPL
jgi:hypothetical protein